MKIKQYIIYLKLLINFIIIIGIEGIKFNSESNLREQLNLNNKVQEKSTATLQTSNKKIELRESSNIQITKKSMSESTLTNKNCNPLCSQCSTNDLNYCTLCKTGMIFYKYNCYSNCPEGTFLNQETRSCQLCHRACPICWGPEIEMCGNSFGSLTKVVSLENEIIDFFNNHVFIKDEVDYWLNNLKMIFLKDKSEIIYPIFNNENPEYSVYLNENNSAELPIGSFAYKNGILIPVPPYIDKNKRLVEFHWTYKSGMWDGKDWHEQYFPRLPSFIKYKGSLNKIYQENNGFWYYDNSRQWVFYASKNIIQAPISVLEKISFLNKIKIDVIHIFNIFLIFL